MWNWDHFYPLWGDYNGPNLEAWSMLAAAAQGTKRIRLGCQVSGMIYRHPALLANIAATVDIISEGRLIIGLGAGWNEMETTAYGMPLYGLKERFDRFDEGVEAIISLLDNEVSNYAGTYVQLTDARCEPKPVQRPHPPICIGGNGRTRTLKTVARYADEWNSLSSPEQWPEFKQVLLGHCEAAGRDPKEITCSVNVRMEFGADLDTVVAQTEAFIAAGVDFVIVNLPQPFSPDILEPLAERLRPFA